MLYFFPLFIIKDSRKEYKLYTSTIEYYNQYINQIDTVVVSINKIYQKSGVTVEAGLNSKEVIHNLKDSISKSTSESKDQRIFDYMGSMFLEDRNKNMISVSLSFDHNSNIIWFKLHKEDNAYGIYYKYIDADMYWHDLLTGVVESKSD